MSLASQLPHTNNNSSNNSLHLGILGELFYFKEWRKPLKEVLEGGRSLYREGKCAHDQVHARE